MAKKETNEPSKIDAALQRFSDMLIKRMEEMKLDWHKGWTGGKAAFGLPQNITGRTYDGSNAFLLFLHTSQNNYKAPVYMTIPQAKNEGIRIKRGEKSVPVFKWGLSIKDKDGKRLSEEDFHNMSEEEKKECLVRPYLKTFNEFNIDQTNLKEVNKEKYDAILARFHNPGIMVQSEGMYVNKALDRMMEKQEWVCNIQYDKEEPGAYYSPSKDIVVIPTKAQFRLHPDNPEECFKDGQEYYGTALHEMAHSTGHPSRLNRLDNSRFGDPAYAKEELVAELTSAMVGNTLGFDRRISDNNAAYLQSWISVLRKEPKFISSVMSDVNKASRMIIENIDKQRVALGEKPLIQGSLDGTEEKVKNDQQLEDIKTGKESEDPKEAVAKQWASFAEKPTLEMPTGETLTVDYNKDNDTLDVLVTNEDGKKEVHSTNYDHDRSLEENIGYVNEELTNLSQYQVKEEKESQDVENGNGLTPKEYFQTLITTLADGQHDEHTASSIKSLTELRDYYKDKPELADWVATASDKELVEAGADMLPNLRYSHKEGRTLYDIETAFSNINAKYEDVTDDRTRQIAHRIEQAKSIISAYHDNTFLNQEKNDEQMEKYADVSAKLNDSPFPYFNMPNGEQLKYQFDNDSKNIVVGKPSPDGTFNEVYRQFYDTDKTIAENMSSVYAALSQKEEFQVKPKEQAVPHEDSNVETNVAGLAESIAETGVPMEQAEKEAKEVVDDKQHESYHEEETKRQQQAKQEKAKEQEAKAKQEKKEGDTPEKTLVHASLLLGALAAAKENEGVWMNKDYKSNAEFMFSKTPITAYNNVMMNLESDQKGYRSNVYTYYKNAEENGASIKHGEKSLPFNWTQWEYQNVTNKEDIISSNQYKLLSDDKKADYVQRASRLTQHIYNIDQTTFPAVSKEKYAEVVEEKGAKGEEWKVKETHNLSADFDKLKEKHPDALILVRVGDFYETYGQDAKRAAEILNLTVTKSNGRDLAVFPYHALDTYLPRLIRAGERIAITESFVPTKASKEETKRLHERGEAAKAVLSQANTLAKQVMEQSGGKYERIMVLQETRYDKDDDKLVVSGIRDNGIGNKYVADIQKTNDIYRAVVAATGTESRLDRSGRNNLLPEDDAKHERLVQEIAAGVLMARQGLPATLSKESQKLIPYWEREIKENPKMIGVIERDVNNAIETIDNLAAKRKVNYEAIRGQLPTKLITEKPKNYTIATDLAKLPSMETKEIVLVKDAANKHADVVLPAGASLEVDNEVPGMRKDRIAIALKKEGFEDVKFYNAGGSLGLNKSNDYFQGKEVSVNQLKQYQLVNHKTIDVADRAKLDMNVEIVKFGAVKDNNGKYAFCIKAKDEPSFSVYPPKEHLNTFFNVRNTPQEKSVREALAQKWYDVASNHPEIKVDAISPRKVDVDMSKIERPTIARSANNFNEKLVFATINGERKSAPITESQWQKMWYANDMAAYKKGIAAIAFEPLLKQSVENQQGETEKETVKETEKVEVKDSPAPKQEQDEQVKQTTSHRMHI